MQVIYWGFWNSIWIGRGEINGKLPESGESGIPDDFGIGDFCWQRDKDAEGAIRQIKEKWYVEALKEYHGNLLLAGIDYDRKMKKHSCVIEKYEMI